MEKISERIYMDIGMGQDAAKFEIDHADSRVRALAHEITERLLQEGLTPLQAQAVLVRAWAGVQSQGVLSLRADQ